jgi:hypothetical protein
MPVAEIRAPFAGDRWSYPQASFWRLEAGFAGELRRLEGGDAQPVAALFRARPSSPGATAPEK